MKRILIYDDEITQCGELKKIISEYFEESVQIDIAVSHTDAENYLNQNEYFAVFIDIELDDNINGISFVKRLNIPEKTSLVYITSHIVYCEEIFTTSPDAFVLKPFNMEKIKRTFEIIKNRRYDKCYLNISIKKNRIERINLEEISYIENISRKLTFFDKNYNVVHEYYGIKISDIAGKMPDFFVRCHHSIFVNLKCVKNISRYYLVMTNDHVLSISQTKFKYTKEKYIEFLGDLI